MSAPDVKVLLTLTPWCSVGLPLQCEPDQVPDAVSRIAQIAAHSEKDAAIRAIAELVLQDFNARGAPPRRRTRRSTNLFLRILCWRA
jgi:hypothetical protein